MTREEAQAAEALAWTPDREIEARFWPKVAKGEGCWEWRAGKFPSGYGAFCFRGRKAARAHRVAWILTNGEIPAGLLVLHRCDNRACVRPDHLFLGTNDDNMRDMVEKGRAARGERNAFAKLNPDRVREIRALGAAGVSQYAIADRFGITQALVWLVVNRKAWRHV